MKKFRSIFIAVAVVLLLASISWAAATSTVQKGTGINVMTIAWTANANGSFTQFTSTQSLSGVIGWIVTDPGSTAPQSLYDITLTTPQGVAMTIADRSATVTEMAKPTVNGVPQAVPIYGKITLDISNNNVNAATGTIYIFYFGD